MGEGIGGGRKRALADSNIDNIVGEWPRGEGHVTDSIENAISRVKEDEIQRSGGVPLVASKAVSKSCVATYNNLLANHSDVSLVNKAREEND